jgi:hypothetical protein
MMRRTLTAAADTSCAACGHKPAPHAAPHDRAGKPGERCTYVRVITSLYRDEDVHDGAIDYFEQYEEIHEITPDEDTRIENAIAVIAGEFLVADDSCSWFFQLDGARDLFTHFEEVSAHLYGFTDDEVDAIRVGIISINTR